MDEAPSFKNQARKVISGWPLDWQQSAGRLLQSDLVSLADLLTVLKKPDDHPDTWAVAGWLTRAIAPSEIVVPLLGILSRHKDPDIRETAFTLLEGIEDSRLVRPFLKYMESVSDEWLRFRIVRGLGPTRDSNALRSLIRILRDDAETALVRGGAAETLPDFDDPTVIEPLIDSLEDSVPEVRFWSAYALSQIRDRLVLDALPALETIALHDETAVDGWWAVQDEAIAAIKKILYRHIDETLLASARRIMGRSGRRRGTERWLEALIDLDVKARREAARTLSEWKNPLTIQPLVVASLGDEDLFVRMYATFSLGMITTEKESVNALHETLANNEIHPWLRAQAADSLGEVGDPGVASDIVPLLNDPDPYIRYWILVALRKIGSESALPALKKRLSDFEEIPFYGVIADEAQHAISSITSVDKRDHRQVN